MQSFKIKSDSKTFYMSTSEEKFTDTSRVELIISEGSTASALEKVFLKIAFLKFTP